MSEEKPTEDSLRETVHKLGDRLCKLESRVHNSQTSACVDQVERSTETHADAIRVLIVSMNKALNLVCEHIVRLDKLETWVDKRNSRFASIEARLGKSQDDQNDTAKHIQYVLPAVDGIIARLDKLEPSNQTMWLAENEERMHRLADRVIKLERESAKIEAMSHVAARVDKLEAHNSQSLVQQLLEGSRTMADRVARMESDYAEKNAKLEERIKFLEVKSIHEVNDAAGRLDAVANSVRDHGELISNLEDQCGSITLRLDGSADLHNKQRATSENHAERLRVSEERLVELEAENVSKPAVSEDEWIRFTDWVPPHGSSVITKIDPARDSAGNPTETTAHPTHWKPSPEPQAKSQDGWIPCSERMPQEGETVITKAHKVARYKLQYKLIRAQDGWIYYETKLPVNHYAPKYWKPIPEEKPADTRDWIPCGEYLPPDGVVVATMDRKGKHGGFGVLLKDKEAWRFANDKTITDSVPTHWKPIPEEKPDDTRGGWIPCDENMPPEDIPVKVKVDAEFRLQRHEGRWCVVAGRASFAPVPTHWKPI